jgi:hypothetical protein
MNDFIIASGDSRGEFTVQKTWTDEEVTKAMNAGADRVLDDEGTGLSDRDRDLINLVVNAQGYVLDHPDATLDDVIEATYTDVDRRAYGGMSLPDIVRGWLDG